MVLGRGGGRGLHGLFSSDDLFLGRGSIFHQEETRKWKQRKKDLVKTAKMTQRSEKARKKKGDTWLLCCLFIVS